MSDSALARLKALNSEPRVRLLRALAQGGAQMTQAQLADAVGRAVSTVSRSLEPLSRDGLVKADGTGEGLAYSLTPAGRRAIAFLFDDLAPAGADPVEPLRTPEGRREPLQYRRPGERIRQARRRRSMLR